MDRLEKAIAGKKKLQAIIINAINEFHKENEGVFISDLEMKKTTFTGDNGEIIDTVYGVNVEIKL